MQSDFENSAYELMNEILNFEYRIESIDHIWDVIFPDHKGKYHYVIIVKYHQVFYLSKINGNLCTLGVTPNKSVTVEQAFRSSYEDGRHDPASVWSKLILSILKWLKIVKKDWLRANRQIHEFYPLEFRYGIVPHSLIRASISDIYRIDKMIGKSKMKKFINLVEKNYFHMSENAIKETMTANEFFEYCKIAYIAGQRKDDCVDESLTGKEMYKRYADGRDNGLLSIDANSQEEFAAWIDGKHPKSSSGGHPWEIKRGGNTTHISLYVSRPRYQHEKGFNITIRGGSIGRLKETLSMFLAIHDAGLPISISGAEGLRKRLLAQDNIGIVPSYDSLHRANQHFPERQDVFDVMHYYELGKFKRRILPFITWEPLPILKPQNIY